MTETVQLSLLSSSHLRVFSKGAVLSVSLNAICTSFLACSSIMLQTWRITPTQNLKLETDASTLDDVTRHLPEGYYSTFRTFDAGTRVLGLAAHLRRLYEPVRTPEVDEQTLRRGLRRLLESYRPNEARVRAVMTRQGQVYLVIASLVLLPTEIYEKGVRVETTALRRQDPRLKSTSFIGRSHSERKHIAQEGIFEALLVKEGKILEGMTSNFFYVKYPRAERASTSGRRALPSAHYTCPGGRCQGSPGAFREREVALYTVHDDILLGVTRATVIAIAQGRGMDVKNQPLLLDQLTEIDEAFITSSSRGIVPVVEIDHITIGQGSPGPVTQDLMAVYESYVTQNAEKI
jgi:branched-subunit amino acid aminotransferase/4-amino-4-deoxychorismate lyase